MPIACSSCAISPRGEVRLHASISGEALSPATDDIPNGLIGLQFVGNFPNPTSESCANRGDHAALEHTKTDLEFASLSFPTNARQSYPSQPPTDRMSGIGGANTWARRDFFDGFLAIEIARLGCQRSIGARGKFWTRSRGRSDLETRRSQGRPPLRETLFNPSLLKIPGHL
ncbi:hypothetical protein P170DRAFT_61462 [Aspergillus steynii IBT 23096]|uniref:Uncharacterized protein n=1 Tax=Aspergillus steynii IBT 23096 TaxID=1392250 RepID=A0A2I2FSZ7_9EURO|nr:uncharacterized protein P170DRAFT_61462 [Aspergillus steynii IBT 23096]PLB43741.1 hypothetical protein P170DRAFT_61462 [Aspergillus steynii IBT 23096]